MGVSLKPLAIVDDNILSSGRAGLHRLANTLCAKFFYQRLCWQLPQSTPRNPPCRAFLITAAAFRSFLLKATDEVTFFATRRTFRLLLLSSPSNNSQVFLNHQPLRQLPPPWEPSLSLVRWRKPSTSTLRCIASHRLLSTKSFSASTLPFKTSQPGAGMILFKM